MNRGSTIVLLFRLILVLALTSSAGLTQQTQLPQLPPGVTIHNVKLENTVRTALQAPSWPRRAAMSALPTDGSVVRIERTELHVYSMELSNNGPAQLRPRLGFILLSRGPMLTAKALIRECPED